MKNRKVLVVFGGSRRYKPVLFAVSVMAIVFFVIIASDMERTNELASGVKTESTSNYRGGMRYRSRMELKGFISKKNGNEGHTDSFKENRVSKYSETSFSRNGTKKISVDDNTKLRVSTTSTENSKTSKHGTPERSALKTDIKEVTGNRTNTHNISNDVATPTAKTHIPAMRISGLKTLNNSNVVAVKTEANIVSDIANPRNSSLIKAGVTRFRNNTDEISKHKQSTNTTSRAACTEEFRSSHLMTMDVVGRSANQLFKICTLIATADDACYTGFLAANQTLNIDSIFQIKNVIRKDVNTSVSSFKKVKEIGWAAYFGSIAKDLDSNYNYTLNGYYQTFKHFQHKKDLVRSSLVFRPEIVTDVLNFFTNMSLNNKTKIGIHIRRGDFLKDKNIKYGYFPSSKTYIQKAMSYFADRLNIEDLVFIIVSDDITWCKENIRYRNVYYSPFKDVGRDLNILTQCDHNIVTTGTFGWMGAWLNETGTVVYDKSYPRFNSILWWGARKTDYYPSWWIGL